MSVLLAEDDPVSCRALEAMLVKAGYEVAVTRDGAKAWEALQAEDSPRLVILDWMMPGLDGVEVCWKVRQAPASTSPYIILLTTKGSSDDIVAGLEAGADDYITKPFNREELRARIEVGVRMVGLQSRLAKRVCQLEQALSQVKQLQGLLPICSYCKRIRDDQNYWQQVEAYISEHVHVQFSHGICPDCYTKFVKPEVDRLRRQKKTANL